LPKIFLLSWKNERILHQLNAGAEEWMERRLGVRLAILQFLFGVIHKKVGIDFPGETFRVLKKNSSGLKRLKMRSIQESFSGLRTEESLGLRTTCRNLKNS